MHICTYSPSCKWCRWVHIDIIRWLGLFPRWISTCNWSFRHCDITWSTQVLCFKCLLRHWNTQSNISWQEHHDRRRRWTKCTPSAAAANAEHLLLVVCPRSCSYARTRCFWPAACPRTGRRAPSLACGTGGWVATSTLQWTPQLKVSASFINEIAASHVWLSPSHVWQQNSTLEFSHSA